VLRIGLRVQPLVSLWHTWHKSQGRKQGTSRLSKASRARHKGCKCTLHVCISRFILRNSRVSNDLVDTGGPCSRSHLCRLRRGDRQCSGRYRRCRDWTFCWWASIERLKQCPAHSNESSRSEFHVPRTARPQFRVGGRLPKQFGSQQWGLCHVHARFRLHDWHERPLLRRGTNSLYDRLLLRHLLQRL